MTTTQQTQQRGMKVPSGALPSGMRSPRGLLAAVVFLLALPVAVLCQVLFGSGDGVAVHLALALGSVLLSFSVFDFNMPRWINWIGCVSAGALAVIFLSQGVADLLQNDSLNYLAYDVLGQRLEGRLPDLIILWFVAMLLIDSQGKTRIYRADQKPRFRALRAIGLRIRFYCAIARYCALLRECASRDRSLAISRTFVATPLLRAGG
jgi:hypothetical protein